MTPFAEKRHVDVNFDCGIQHRAADGRRYL
jgi:hypothetical protein